jgi:8-oxo-dGTP pyrophosphatase MutT (NUDIX family)
MIKRWPKLKSRIIGDYRIFQLRRDTNRSPRTNQEHDFYILDTTDWINIVPITPEGQVVLIRQYRHGTEEVTLEIPGGMVDEDDGSALISAERELLEETGYKAKELIHIGTVTPNPAILSNHCHTFLALNARQVMAPQFDGTEDIQLEVVDASAVPDLIDSGQITHALVIAAFYFYEQYRGKNGA